MQELLIDLDRSANKSLQSQLREVLVSAILQGHLGPGEKLPSTRRLSTQLGISRNTSVLVYQGLTEDGYLRTNQRSGYFVNEAICEIGMANHGGQQPAPVEPVEGLNWGDRIKRKPGAQANIRKPRDWQKLKFPFIYGQPDRALFPITDWRDCVYKAMGKQWLDDWSQDTLDNDDPLLIEQIRNRILPRRGILASEDHILVTLVSQQALYMVASLLVGERTPVVLEEPGYPDARNIFSLRTENVHFAGVDAGGLKLDEVPAETELVYTTPSHQLPTTVTMPIERRKALLAQAEADDFVIVEDDYELETNFTGKPVPALKSLDKGGRVIYLGSFSKTLFPGLRLGFVVASRELIAEMRALRRLMVRHPPNNNQRSTAFFLSLGYYDVFVRRLHRTYEQRWKAMGEGLARHVPHAKVTKGMGGSSYWMQFDDTDRFDGHALVQRAQRESIYVEPGDIYFARPDAPSCLRLGFSSIPTASIEPGLAILGKLLAKTG
ncbi:MAG: PLP-dependent aminotransferase family protein [Pseudomonadota bacterium]